MTILIIIDGKVYRAKKKWPITVSGVRGVMDDFDDFDVCNAIEAAEAVEAELLWNGENNILAACFDEVKSESYYTDMDGFNGTSAFTLNRLTGKE